MKTVPVIIDSLASGGASDDTVLSRPVGAGTVFDIVARELQSISNDPITILTAFETDTNYVRHSMFGVDRIATALSFDGFNDFVHALEPSDRLLIVDPKYFPKNGFRLRALVSQSDACAMAKHWLPLITNESGHDEFLQFAPKGTVRSIRRFYDGVTHFDSPGLTCSLMPVALALRASHLDLVALGDLRFALASQNVPSQDIPYTDGMFDLATDAGLLEANEHWLDSQDGNGAPCEMRTLAPGIYVGSRAQIAPRARIVGPVVIHDDARIENDAVIIGPSVIGRGSVVRSGAMVAQSVILDEVDVPAGRAARRRVVRSGTVLVDCAPVVGKLPTSTAVMRSPASKKLESIDWFACIKRAMDILGSGCGLLLLSPLLVLTAVLVKLTSRGPALYFDPREGRDGTRFKCIKFRTMCNAAHDQQRSLAALNEVDGPHHKIKNDPRITPLGYWLRKTNVDELPQLFNVLIGDMSLIGPRPSPFRENQICVSWRQARLSVRPGITGLWQLCRQSRDDADFHQWIYYDTLYVRHMSIALDNRILLATLLTCGGRVSVPVTSLIPARQLQATSSAILPS